MSSSAFILVSNWWEWPGSDSLYVSFFLLVSESLYDCKAPKELLRCSKKALCEKIVFNNHENQVKTSSFALKTILKKVAEKWLFLTKKVADFRADHLETLNLSADPAFEPSTTQLQNLTGKMATTQCFLCAAQDTRSLVCSHCDIFQSLVQELVKKCVEKFCRVPQNFVEAWELFYKAEETVNWYEAKVKSQPLQRLQEVKLPAIKTMDVDLSAYPLGQSLNTKNR